MRKLSSTDHSVAYRSVMGIKTTAQGTSEYVHVN